MWGCCGVPWAGRSSEIQTAKYTTNPGGRRPAAGRTARNQWMVHPHRTDVRGGRQPSWEKVCRKVCRKVRRKPGFAVFSVLFGHLRTVFSDFLSFAALFAALFAAHFAAHFAALFAAGIYARQPRASLHTWASLALDWSLKACEGMRVPRCTCVATWARLRTAHET